MKSKKEKSKTAGKVPALLNQSLLTDIRSLIFSARRQMAQAVNAGLTLIDRARCFLEATTLSEKWIQAMVGQNNLGARIT